MFERGGLWNRSGFASRVSGRELIIKEMELNGLYEAAQGDERTRGDVI